MDMYGYGGARYPRYPVRSPCPGAHARSGQCVRCTVPDGVRHVHIYGLGRQALVWLCPIDQSDHLSIRTVLIGYLHLAHQMTDTESFIDIYVSKCVPDRVHYL